MGLRSAQEAIKSQRTQPLAEKPGVTKIAFVAVSHVDHAADFIADITGVSNTEARLFVLQLAAEPPVGDPRYCRAVHIPTADRHDRTVASLLPLLTGETLPELQSKLQAAMLQAAIDVITGDKVVIGATDAHIHALVSQLIGEVIHQELKD